MKIDEQRKFNVLRKKFTNGNYDINTIRLLVDEVRNSIEELNCREFGLLMDIPLSVMRQDLDISNYTQWQENNKDYFGDNLYGFEEECFVRIKEKIESGKYNLDDIIKLGEFVKENFETLKKKYGRSIEVPLRNFEITIGSTKLVNKENLMMNGEVFAYYIEKAINLN